MSTNKHLKTYFQTQGSGTIRELDYNKKDYPDNLSMNDKKIVDSKQSRRLPKINKKIILLLFCIIILTLIFSRINNDNRSYTVGLTIAIISILIIIPFFYLMKADYYFIVGYIIIISIIGSMGYGWGIISVMININPLTNIEIPTNVKKNSAQRR